MNATQHEWSSIGFYYFSSIENRIKVVISNGFGTSYAHWHRTHNLDDLIENSLISKIGIKRFSNEITPQELKSKIAHYLHGPKPSIEEILLTGLNFRKPKHRSLIELVLSSLKVINKWIDFQSIIVNITDFDTIELMSLPYVSDDKLTESRVKYIEEHQDIINSFFIRFIDLLKSNSNLYSYFIKPKSSTNKITDITELTQLLQSTDFLLINLFKQMENQTLIYDSIKTDFTKYLHNKKELIALFDKVPINDIDTDIIPTKNSIITYRFNDQPTNLETNIQNLTNLFSTIVNDIDSNKTPVYDLVSIINSVNLIAKSINRPTIELPNDERSITSITTINKNERQKSIVMKDSSILVISEFGNDFSQMSKEELLSLVRALDVLSKGEPWIDKVRSNITQILVKSESTN
jgi:hypothetical protein